MVSDEDVNQLLHQRRYDAAFALLMSRYEHKVFRLAVSILRHTPRAEEVTQEIFFKLWQVVREYDGRAALSTWIYTIARNTCLSAVRAESYRETVPLDENALPAAGETISGSAEIKQAVDRLPEAQRQVIFLYYWQERSIDEVARMLDLPQGTVKSHLYRARRTLAKSMEKVSR